MKIVPKILAVCVSVFSFTAFGQELVPATFGSKAESLIDKLDFPDISEDTPLAVKCAGRITSRGVFDSLLCLNDSNFKGDSSLPREVGAEVSKIAANVRVEPAKVDGKRVKVWYSFTILFENRGGTEHVEIVDNHARNQSEYGVAYQAAQRYEGDVPSCASNLSSAVFVQASVSDSGQVQDVSPMGNAEMNSCTERLIANLQESTYIPAMSDGSPVASTYVEIFHR